MADEDEWIDEVDEEDMIDHYERNFDWKDVGRDQYLKEPREFY
jgi:hypothetical protein